MHILFSKPWPWAIATFLALLTLIAVFCLQPQQQRRSDSHSKADIEETPENIIADFTSLYIDSPKGLPFRPKFMGVRTMQNPMDLWVIQEIITEVQPEIVIECGTAYGGSALYYASILNGIRDDFKVFTIDIEPDVEHGLKAIDSPEIKRKAEQLFDDRIEVIESDSLAPQLLEKLSAECDGKRTLVILDSCHNTKHVLHELNAYSKFISDGSYIIVQDTIIDQKEAWIQTHAQCEGYESSAGPAKAVESFLQTSSGFEIDKSKEIYLFTFCPSGFLKKVRN